eukprot:3337226-Prymnesium_polylepis.1
METWTCGTGRTSYGHHRVAVNQCSLWRWGSDAADTADTADTADKTDTAAIQQRYSSDTAAIQQRYSSDTAKGGAEVLSQGGAGRKLKSGVHDGSQNEVDGFAKLKLGGPSRHKK